MPWSEIDILVLRLTLLFERLGYIQRRTQAG